MIKIVHRTAATLATLSILVFFTATILVELFGSHEAIATVKRLILTPGLLILIPSIMAAGISGFVMAKKATTKTIGRKKKRMPILAINGIVVLVPSAIVLNQMASAGDFGTTFYLIQAVELIAGGLNLLLLFKNIIDGRMLSGKAIKKVSA